MHTQLGLHTRVRARPRAAEKDRRRRSRAQPRLQVFGVIQDPAFLPEPSSAPSLPPGPCVSRFQLAALAPGLVQLRGREGGRGRASSPLPPVPYSREPPGPPLLSSSVPCSPGLGHMVTPRRRGAQQHIPDVQALRREAEGSRGEASGFGGSGTAGEQVGRKASKDTGTLCC